MNQTIADSFFADKRVAQAQELLKEALKEHQQKVLGTSPGNKKLKKVMMLFLSALGSIEEGHSSTAIWAPVFGRGPLVELMDGSIKYDFITGIGVHYFGHSHPGVIEAMVKGSLSDVTMQGHLQQNGDSAQFVSLMLDQANKYGAHFDHCFLTTSGVMANENALKISFQKRAPATRVLAFEKCFAGRTLAVAQITDKPQYRLGLPPTLDVDYVPFYDHSDDQGSIQRSVNALKKHLNRYPGQHAIFLMELIQGEAGSWGGSTPFFEALIAVCREHNVSVIVDEVQTFARTSELFAFQLFKLDKLVDVVTVGKNSQVCCTLFEKIMLLNLGS